MNCHLMFSLAVASAALLFTANSANAQTLVTYISDNTLDSDALAPDMTLAGVTASVIDNTADDDNPVRSEFGPIGTGFIYAGNSRHATELATTDVSDDYLGFTISATAAGSALDLSDISFDFGIALNIGPGGVAGDGVPTLNAGQTFGYSLFVSTDGGSTFSNIGQQSVTTTAALGELSGQMISETIDLTGFAPITNGNNIEFRIVNFVDDESTGALGSGSSGGQIAVALSNLSVNGSVVGGVPQTRRVLVFLQAGQSNADGRGLVSDISPELAAPQTDVQIYSVIENATVIENLGRPNLSGQLVDLQPGLAEPNISDGAIIDPPEFGPEVTLGRGLADFYASDPDTSVAIIKYANGGTNLASRWRAGGTAGTQNDGPEYQIFQQTVTAGRNAIQAANPDADVIISGAVWVQGEGDAGNRSNANAYETNLTNFINDFRLTYGAGLPFVIGEIGVPNGMRSPTNSAREYADQVRLAQQAVADNLEGVSLVEAVSGIGNSFTHIIDVNPGDEIHFSASGQEALGFAFAQQLLPEPLLGDVNLDGSVNFLDIAPFIGILTSTGFQAEADLDLNGTVNFLDIAPFISVLANS